MRGAPEALSFFLLNCLIYVHARDIVKQGSQINGDNREEGILLWACIGSNANKST